MVFCENQICDLIRPPWNCIYKPTWTTECAFLYPCTACLCFISLWLSFSEQLAQSLLNTVNHQGLFWLNRLVCLSHHMAFFLGVLASRADEYYILIPLRCSKFRTWHPKHLFKVYLAEKFVSFSLRVFS